MLIKHSKCMQWFFVKCNLSCARSTCDSTWEISSTKREFKWFFTRINFINFLCVLMQTNDMMQCPISIYFLLHSLFSPWNMHEIYLLKDDGLRKWMEIVLLWCRSLSCTDSLKKRFYVLVWWTNLPTSLTRWHEWLDDLNCSKIYFIVINFELFKN